MIYRRRLKCCLMVSLATLLFWLYGDVCLAQGRFGSPSSDGSDARRVLQDLRHQEQEPAKPWLGAVVREFAQDPDIRGLRVESVVAGSPAEKAGMLSGDVIVQIDGKAVSNPRVFMQLVSGFQVGAEYPIAVLRDGTTVELTICPAVLPASRWSSTSATAKSELSDKPIPRKGPTDINVLRYALIDPQTRVVTFIGKYDPAYNTGPIPYADYLKVALENPYPAFSLDPPEETLLSLRRAGKIIDADIARMNDPEYCNQWAQRVTNLLIYDSALQTDRDRLYRNCAAAMGITAGNFKRMYEAATGNSDIPSTEFMELAGKMIRGIGLTKAGDALGVLSAGGTPEELMHDMAEKLGLSSQYRELAMRGLSPEEFRKEEIILVISELCRQFESPESEIQSKASAIRSGESANLIIDYMGEQLSRYIAEKSGRKMINGLVLGPEVMSKMYNLPVPKAELVFKDLPSDSLLGDVFFKSDYRLKSVCVFPDAKDRVSTHLTEQEFIQREASSAMSKALCNADIRAGNRLVPGDVKLRVSPTGNVVEFEKSKIKVVGWVIEMLGMADTETNNFISTTIAKHADYLTEHYEEYAKVYPEWHKLSEAAKVIALARWAQSNGYALRTAGTSWTTLSQPKYVNGFWSAVFQVDDHSQYLTFVAEGGASFAKDEGESWLTTHQDVAVTSDISKQLAASAVFAEQSLCAAISGDLESARELSEKSAQAMTGEIDLTRPPSLDGIPVPADPASYAAATGAAIEEASECLDKINSAAQDIQRAQQLSTNSPAEAERLKQQATKTQEDAQARLDQILGQIRNYKSDPSRAGDAILVLRSDSVVVAPIGSNPSPASGSSSSQGASSAGTGNTVAESQDWSKILAELDEVNKHIAATREALIKLNSSIQADRKLFEEWEKSASEGMDRCVSMIGEIALDVSISGLSERHETLYELAKKLPGKPEDVIEKYRYLASLTQRMDEANAVRGLADLADKENKTEAELWETLRDGINQLSGLFSLDKTIPGKWWKYGILAADTAYNLTELRLTWNNMKTLEANNERYAEAVQKLTARMKRLVDRQKEIRKKIEAGSPMENLINK